MRQLWLQMHLQCLRDAIMLWLFFFFFFEGGIHDYACCVLNTWAAFCLKEIELPPPLLYAQTHYLDLK